MSEHVTPIRVYLAVFFSLLALTALTTWVAFFDLGALNNLAAVGIAVIKATLVILFFMHVRHSTRLTKLVVVAGFFWLLILIGFTLSDTFTRSWLLASPAP